MSDVPDDGLRGLAPIKRRRRWRIMPNTAHQSFHGFMSGASYELAVVEFDDQGRCYDRKQMDGIADRVDQMRKDEVDALIFVFVPGWKHDAQTDDESLSGFRRVLTDVAAHEKSTGGARPVLGIFVGWRGLNFYGDQVSEAFTYWNRQAAGHRVARGSIRELFGRLRHYRNHRLKQEPPGSPLVVITGHSFGGMIVYSAVAQSLIEAASDPTVDVIPSLADLVLLVNPAIEGERYIPIQDLLDETDFKTRTSKQLPIFVCAQADNDFAVGKLFPPSATFSAFFERKIGPLETEAATHAIGFVSGFVTHHLTGSGPTVAPVLAPPGDTQANPFWVVRAAPDIIDDHGGIWKPPFLEFLASIVFQHVEASNGTRGARVKSSSS